MAFIESTQRYSIFYQTGLKKKKKDYQRASTQYYRLYQPSIHLLESQYRITINLFHLYIQKLKNDRLVSWTKWPIHVQDFHSNLIIWGL